MLLSTDPYLPHLSLDLKLKPVDQPFTMVNKVLPCFPFIIQSLLLLFKAYTT